MDGDEDIALVGVGDGRPFLQGHVLVAGAGEDDLQFLVLVQDGVQPLADVQGDVFFLQAQGAVDRARVLAAVAGIDDDAVHAQPELAGDGRTAPRAGGVVRRLRPAPRSGAADEFGLAVDVEDDAEGRGQVETVVLADLVEIEDHADGLRLPPADADPLQVAGS